MPNIFNFISHTCDLSLEKVPHQNQTVSNAKKKRNPTKNNVSKRWRFKPLESVLKIHYIFQGVCTYNKNIPQTKKTLKNAANEFKRIETIQLIQMKSNEHLWKTAVFSFSTFSSAYCYSKKNFSSKIIF